MVEKRITRRLKVYTTRIGIHDWAVAVPSQKEALKAWDVRENLFASGAAKPVDDPDIVAAAMKTPGVPVIAPGQPKPRLPDAKPRERHQKPRAAEPKSNVIRLDERRPSREPESKKSHRERPVVERPPPDRSRLDAAEDEIREFEIEIKVRRKELARRKQDLERELESFETDTETRRRRLERQLEKARDSYERLKAQ